MIEALANWMFDFSLITEATKVILLGVADAYSNYMGLEVIGA